jgi:hypothetical protein
MSTDETNALVQAVAVALFEWEDIDPEDREEYDNIGEVLFPDHNEWVCLPLTRRDLIVFAALAKAEIAKRGWECHQAPTYPTGNKESYVVFYKGHTQAEHLETEQLVYEGTDPQSEALAVLQAVREALGVEAGDA